MLDGAAIVWDWLTWEYWRLKPIPAEVAPPATVESCPVTGTVRFNDILRRTLSSLPVQMSTLAFLIAAAIFCWVAWGMDVGSLVPEELDALARSVLMSLSRAFTLTPERMCVVAVPPMVSEPTTAGLESQCWGSIPSADRPPPP